MHVVQDEHPIDQELLWRLGKIITSWSSLENWLAMLLGTLMGADLAASGMVTNGVSISLQVKCIRGILSVHANKEPGTDRILDLLNRADELRLERNELAHGLWHASDPADKTALVNTVNLDRSEIIRDRLVTVPDLDDLIIQIDDWITDYTELGRELGFPQSRGGKPAFS
jgi:hypothetical protein